MINQDPYENLKKELAKIEEWPMVYMFKFIVLSENKKIALVTSRFSNFRKDLDLSWLESNK